jgi:hypothetical protein
MSEVLEGVKAEFGATSTIQRSVILMMCETVDPEISPETRQRMADYLRARSTFRIATVNDDSEQCQDLSAMMHQFANNHRFVINDIAMFLIVNGSSG